MKKKNSDYYIKKFLDYITVSDQQYLIAMDFDGTMSHSLFPTSALPGPKVTIQISRWIVFNYDHFGLLEDFDYEISVVDIMKHWVKKGDQFILWTCRTPTLYENRDSLQDAIDWSRARGIEFINHNRNHHNVWDDPRKILVDRYIDDNAMDIYDQRNWNQNFWNKRENTVLDILSRDQNVHKNMLPKD